MLKDTSFIIPAGKLTAVIGPSGGGKTTILRLIARFWDVDAGKTTCGGKDLRNPDSDQWISGISIARAILKNAPLLLLDEPAASLDACNEVLIQQAVSELVKGRTVVINDCPSVKNCSKCTPNTCGRGLWNQRKRNA